MVGDEILKNILARPRRAVVLALLIVTALIMTLFLTGAVNLGAASKECSQDYTNQYGSGDCEAVTGLEEYE